MKSFWGDYIEALFFVLSKKSSGVVSSFSLLLRYIDRMTQTEFEHIAVKLRRQMFKVAFDYFGNADDADDVAQEALLKLWQYVKDRPMECDASRLAIRIAKWGCVDFDRRHRMPQVSIDNDSVGLGADAAPSPHDELVATESREMLQQALKVLNPREREAFELRQVDGMTTEEVAHEMGVNVASVQSMVSRARRKVFENLQKLMSI